MLIADYIVIRRTQLDLAGLYKKDGPYWYSGGFNPLAIIALVLGIALASRLPGRRGLRRTRSDVKAAADLTESRRLRPPLQLTPGSPASACRL